MELELFQLENLSEGVYRSVLISIGGELYMYFTKADTKAKEVVGAILDLHKLAYKVTQLRYDRGPAPADGERYSAHEIGVATYREKDDQKFVILSGYSIDYNLPVGGVHLELIKEKYPDVKFLVTDYR